MNRATKVCGHIVPTPNNTSSLTTQNTHASDDDVVIVSAVRTALTKGRKGGFKDTYPNDMLAAVLKAVVERVNLDPSKVEDIQVGNVLQPGAGAGSAREAMFYAGFPYTTSVAAVNRQCSSGLQSVANIAASIKAGIIGIGIGAGVESMTKGWGAAALSEVNPRSDEFPLAADCQIPMGITSENVAKEFGVTREKQDKFAAESFRRAVAAQKAGVFKGEIVPVKTTVVDGEGKEKEVLVDYDDGVKETPLETLKKLKPAFSDTGSTTAGNSSQVTDGAAAVLMMRRSIANKLGLRPIAKFVSYAVVGVPPSVMGIGPAFAIPEALKKANISLNDVSVFEINEAFASQAVYCVEKLGIDPSKVNPNGGAIALGHPLGCTGSRQIATIIPQLKRTKGKYGVISMCIGTGMGAAAVIENEN